MLAETIQSISDVTAYACPVSFTTMALLELTVQPGGLYRLLEIKPMVRLIIVEHSATSFIGILIQT